MTEAIDIQAVRADTPGTDHGVHLLACGSSLMPRQVLDAQKDFLDLEATVGGYEAAARAQCAVQAFYDESARMFNCAAHEVAYMENATAAWNSVAHSVR